MSALARGIADEIRLRGPMPLRRFMELALYHPAHGYYAGGRARIGRAGDFFTSVSVGPLFGRLLAVQFAEMWERLGRPERFALVEQGANNGDFAHDVLGAVLGTSLDAHFHPEFDPGFRAALRYHIVEPFPAQAARQRERLAHFGGRIHWRESVDALPPFTGVHFSNELADAFPVHRVVFRNGEWREQCVALEGPSHAGCEGSEENATTAFALAEGPISDPALAAFLPHLPAVEGYETEVNLAAPRWLESVLARLERGYVLLADYGFSRADYYLPERREGTFAAYRQHRRCDRPAELLRHPAQWGEWDLTAHVDFTTLTECALATNAAGHIAGNPDSIGIAVAGFTDQHHFLAALGRAVFPDITDPRQFTPARQKAQRAFAMLVHPTTMGRDFHYLALAKNAPSQLLGYALGRGNALW